MKKINLSKISITPKSHKILSRILFENPKLKEIFVFSETFEEALENLKIWVMSYLQTKPEALAYYQNNTDERKNFKNLKWREIGAIRILDYIENSGRSFEDLNLHGEKVTNAPFLFLWQAVKMGRGGATEEYFIDMLHLFRQFSGSGKLNKPSKEKVLEWMDRHPSGLDSEIIRIREKNEDRILKVIIRRIEDGEITSSRYTFEPGLTDDEKYARALEWWDTSHFHLKFAVRTPELLNEMLDFSLNEETLKLLSDAINKGIPVFVNPYYLSLLNVDVPDFAVGADHAIRDYVFVSRPLIEEFGSIVAWEKEDIVEPGKPNAAGWILPSYHNIHRRYPEVAILIPDTVGRTCGGLCVSCQRMYDFQNGHLNFDLKKLMPKKSWPEKLKDLLKYFENDAQLRDILITGGDALMSRDNSLKLILDEVYNMAIRKIEANKNRADGKKYAEMVRVRLGTRLPIYLPQRIEDNLINILAEFKVKASKIGITQFIIQTHFETAMEITPEVKKGVEMLISAGWTVTNQQVFTSSAARRGHAAKLRQVLNEIGVLPYYTFSVKGYQENRNNFANNARTVQEQTEEKILGHIPDKYYNYIKNLPMNAENMVENIDRLRKEANLPFLATDRNILNLPGVGKSLTFRTIGITHDGRRILEFNHDTTRRHSPIIKEMGKVVIIESKSINEYLEQLDKMGENLNEYESIWGYSIGESEPRMPVYEYPEYDFNTTDELSNFQMVELERHQV